VRVAIHIDARRLCTERIEIHRIAISACFQFALAAEQSTLAKKLSKRRQGDGGFAKQRHARRSREKQGADKSMSLCWRMASEKATWILLYMSGPQQTTQPKRKVR
jgi:hypothetical protein